MRWPATGLSNPPLSKSTPRRATLNPHVLRVDPAGFRLVLHAADERAAIRKDCEAVALHVRDEHPAVSHVGRLPGGGGFGLKQRKHAVTGVRIANSIPYVAMAPPYTNGTFASIAASLSKNRVSRLSVPSTTMSMSCRMSRTVAEWTSFESGSTSICEFTDRRRSAAASAFGRSTSDSE